MVCDDNDPDDHLKVCDDHDPDDQQKNCLGHDPDATCRFAMIYHLAKDAALKRANTIPGNLGLTKPLPVRYRHHRHHHHSQKHNHHHRRCHHHHHHHNDHFLTQPTVSASGENNG